MPKPEISLVYVADGFEEDCEALLQRYLICNVHNFQAFCKIWKEMKFSYVFHGRVSTAELGEFSEEAVYIAKKIMVKKINCVEESIGAMFILYGVVHLQPFKRFVHVRLVPEDVSAINRIESFAREHKRYDVLYILGSLLIEGPLQFHLAEREYGLERSVRKCFEETVSIEKLSLMRGVLYQNMELLDVLQAETDISQKYKSAKSILQTGTGKHQPQHDLNYTNEHLASELTSSLKHLLRCGAFFEKPPTKHQVISNSEVMKQVEGVLEVKERAMRNVVGPMRHLNSIHPVNSHRAPIEVTDQRTSKDLDGKRDSTKILEITSKWKRKRRNNTPRAPLEGGEQVDYILPDDGGMNRLETVNLASLPMLTDGPETEKAVPVVIEFIDEMKLTSVPSEASTSAESGFRKKKKLNSDADHQMITSEDLKVKEDIIMTRVPSYKRSTLNKLGMLPVANVTEHRPKRKLVTQPKWKNGDGE